MMKAKVLIFSLASVLSVSVLAKKYVSYAPSNDEQQFCLDRNDENFSKELVNDPHNLMAFRNQGGIGGGGVCWWHSRFQRNALYLTVFKPEEKRPVISEVEKIIKKIRKGKEVVVIPGYENFYEFTSHNRSLVQKELEAWQVNDGAVKFAWVKGLSGNNIVKPEELKRMMDELYEEVEGKNTIAYQKLQIKGITAHAWLVVNMKQVGEDGYDLEVIDSNEQYMTRIYKYRLGDTNFTHWFYGDFTPYLEKTNEMDKIKTVIDEKCRPDKLDS